MEQRRAMFEKGSNPHRLSLHQMNPPPSIFAATLTHSSLSPPAKDVTMQKTLSNKTDNEYPIPEVPPKRVSKQSMKDQSSAPENSDDTLESLKRELKEAQARLKARDDYLQNTIMNTARRIAELDLKVTELQGEKEESESELIRLQDENYSLQEKVSSLEQENLDYEMNVAEHTPIMTEDDIEKEEPLVVRDMPTQTDEEITQFTSTAIVDTNNVVSEGNSDISKDIEATHSTIAGDNSGTVIDYELLMQYAEDSRLYQLQQLQTYTLEAILIAKDELIFELQEQILKSEAEARTTISQNMEMQSEMLELKAQLLARNRVIDILMSRVDSLEALLTTALLKKTLNPALNIRFSNTLSLNSPISPVTGNFLPSPPMK